MRRLQQVLAEEVREESEGKLLALTHGFRWRGSGLLRVGWVDGWVGWLRGARLGLRSGLGCEKACCFSALGMCMRR